MDAKRIILFVLVAALCIAFAVPYVEVNAEPVTLGLGALAGFIAAMLAAHGISMAAQGASRVQVQGQALKLWQDWQTNTATPVDSGLGEQLELVADADGNRYLHVTPQLAGAVNEFCGYVADTYPSLKAGNPAALWSTPAYANVTFLGGSISALQSWHLSDVYNKTYVPESPYQFRGTDLHGSLMHINGVAYGNASSSNAAFIALASGSKLYFGKGTYNQYSASSTERYMDFRLPGSLNANFTISKHSLGLYYSGTQSNQTDLGFYLVHGLYTDGLDYKSGSFNDAWLWMYTPLGALGPDKSSVTADQVPGYIEWALIHAVQGYNTGGYAGSLKYKFYYVDVYDLTGRVCDGPSRANYSTETRTYYDMFFGDSAVDASDGAEIVAIPDGAIDVPTWTDPTDLYLSADYIYPGISLDGILEGAVDSVIAGTIADTNTRILESSEVQVIEEDTPMEVIQEASPASDSLQPVIGLDTVFPFCIPFDVAYFVERLQAARVAPVIEWPIVVPSLGINEMITVDLSGWETVAAILRTLELIVFVIGLAYATRSMFIRG